MRTAPTRSLEAILQSGSNQPTAREIRESGYAALFSEGGEDELQQQQPTDAAPDAKTGATIAADTTTTDPADPPAQQDAVTYAWQDVFGELTDRRTVSFLSNAVRGYSAEEVLRALALAKGQLEKGKEIAAPAAYVKKILASRMKEIGAGHRTAKQSPGAGHRNQVDWSAVAERTSQAAEAFTDADADQIDLDVAAERQAAEERRAQERAEWQQREAERKEQERIAAERVQIERQLQREKDAARHVERKRRDVAGVIANVTGNEDMALRMADDFLRVTPDTWWQEKRLDMLTMQRNRAGKTLTTAEATAILHGGLNAAAPARVAA